MPFCCPICARTTLQPILASFVLTAREVLSQPEEKQIQGIYAWKCTEFGHIFFTRVADQDFDPLENFVARGD